MRLEPAPAAAGTGGLCAAAPARAAASDAARPRLTGYTAGDPIVGPARH